MTKRRKSSSVGTTQSKKRRTSTQSKRGTKKKMDSHICTDWDEEGDNTSQDGGWAGIELADPTEAICRTPAVTVESVKPSALFARYDFGPAAFSREPELNIPRADPNSKLRGCLSSIMAASVPGVRSWRSRTRDPRPVLSMIQTVYEMGLFTLSGNVNAEIVPAIRYIFQIMNDLRPNDPKRVASLTRLAEAMMDCQQVQAREILRIYGDLTNQTQTLDRQIRYFFLKHKEAALEHFMSVHHPKCDLDHTRVPPSQQRAHLKSAYITLLASDFGLGAVHAAQSDRFVHGALQEVNTVWRKKGGTKGILQTLKSQPSLPQFVTELCSDINNQSASADRLINREVIFRWAADNMKDMNAHHVFYDEERANEFAFQDPAKPNAENQFQPFLSHRVLLDVLLRMGFVRTIVPARNSAW